MLLERIVEIDGHRYRRVEVDGNDCIGCIFKDTRCYNGVPDCTLDNENHTDVEKCFIFKKLPDNTKALKNISKILQYKLLKAGIKSWFYYKNGELMLHVIDYNYNNKRITKKLKVIYKAMLKMERDFYV